MIYDRLKMQSVGFNNLIHNNLLKFLCTKETPPPSEKHFMYIS